MTNLDCVYSVPLITINIFSFITFFNLFDSKFYFSMFFNTNFSHI